MSVATPVEPRVASQDARVFLIAWSLVTVAKVIVAAWLPLFVDEAFYWQEGQHMAWAYSDLPGLTAWLTRLGTSLAGHNVVALRLPFLLIGALLPWLVAKIAARWFGETDGWRAGTLTVLMPLSGTLGLLAVPDVPMALATVLCLDAGARLMRQASAAGAVELALGLVVGALSHYRFAGVIGIGFIALLLLSEGRRLFRDPRVLIALAIGAVAWAPLLLWNMRNGESGLRFQMVDRHPWAFHADGIQFIGVQAVMVTPLLFVALVATFLMAWRRDDAPSEWRYFGLLGGISTLFFFVLGFFADNERVSFHWTLPGYLALLAAVPTVIDRWPRWLRTSTWVLAVAGLLGVLGYYTVAASGQLRAAAAAEKWYPSNFAGWHVLAREVDGALKAMPPGTQLVAGNFKIGSELGFALGRSDIPVLDHALNTKHGRAPQLALWKLELTRLPDVRPPTLLVLGATDVRYKDLLDRYRAVCEMAGPLTAARVVNIDHGAQRFMLVSLPANRIHGPCTAPAMSWVDQPVSGARVPRRFNVSGWAVREGVGVASVEVTLDGTRVATARYGRPYPGVAQFWTGLSDPGLPDVGFDASVDASGVPAGRHWLGLVVVGRDGNREPAPETPIDISP